MNSGQMVRRVQRLFGDEAEAQITVPFILDMLSDAQMDIARKTGCLDKHVQTSAVSNDGSYAIPEDFLLIRRATFNGVPLKFTSIEQVDQLDSEYDNGKPVGTPTHFFLTGRTVFLFPIPGSSGTGNFDLWYTKMPAQLEDITDTAEVPANYHEDMIRYALARCKESEDEYDISEKIMGDYSLRMTESISEVHDSYEGSYPAVRTLPGD